VKKCLVFLSLVVLLFGMVGSVYAYTSTFNVAGDFSLTGFSSKANPNDSLPVATTGPDTVTIDNPTGTYNLEIPPPGTYDWYIEFESLALDFYGDSTPELAFEDVGPIYVGNYATPIPGLSGSYYFGDVYIPEYENSGVTVGNYTLNGLTVDWDMTMSGTDITQIVFTIGAENLADTLNRDFTFLDNTLGGANGIIDGHATANFSVTAVPEPSTILLSGLGLLGMGAYIRRRRSKA